MEILGENQIKIKYIYHLGDVHIRKNNDRHAEYMDVFKKLCEKIKNDDVADESLILCTGDVFHDGMSPESIMLTKDFFGMLASISDVIIFRGNHDQRSKSCESAIDFLASNLYKLKTPKNIYLLEKSGIYLYGKNLLFGYTDVYENKVTKIEKIEEIEEIEEKIKIGLWHGTMNQSKTTLGETLEGKFNCSDFKDYDLVMLGDIHKFQFLNQEKTIAYCSSTIQQNFGEDRQHGYIRWNVIKKTGKFVNIENDYGFVTLTIKKNKIIKQDYDFTKKTYLRIKYSDSDPDELGKIIEDISKKTEIISLKYEDESVKNLFNYGDEIENENENDIEKIDNDTVTVERLMKYIKENCVLDDAKKDKMENKLKEITKIIGYNYDVNKRDIKLKSLKFSNFNIYGEKNYINFEQMRGIMNVCGKNAIGKSSLIMCICYAIWGYAEDGNIGKYDYVNNTKKSMETEIILVINGVEYKIVRNGYFKDVKRDTSNFKHNVIFYKNNQDISGKSINEIESQIVEIVGELCEFKKLCIMEQKKNESFLDLTDSEKTKKICNLLKLDIYTIIQNTLSQEELLNNKQIKDIEKKIYVVENNGLEYRANIIEDKIADLEEKIVRNKEDLSAIEGVKNNLEKEKIALEIKIDDLKQVNYDLIQKENITIKNIEKNREILVKNAEEIKKKEEEISILQKEQKLKKYKDVEKKNDEFNVKKQMEIEKIANEINDLWKGYTKIENPKYDLDKLNGELKKNEKDQDVIETDIKNTEKIINDINIENEKYEKDEKKNADGYKKYIEYKDELNTILTTEKNLLVDIETINNNIKNLQKDYKKNEKDYQKNDELLETMKKEFAKYNDIEKKKDEYESEIHKKIEILMNERDKLSKEFENIEIKEKPDKNVNKKIEELKKEINNNDEKILNIEKNIIDIDSEKIKIPKYTDIDIKKKSELYIFHKEKIEKITNDIANIIKKRESYQDIIKLLKNYKYNEECEVCMSNDTTKKLLNTQKELDNIEKIFTEKTDEKVESEKLLKKNEKYYKAKEDIIINDDIEKKIVELKKNRETLENLNIIANDKIASLEKLTNEYEIYLLKNQKNSEIEEKLRKNKEAIDMLKKSKYEEYDKYIEIHEKILKITNISQTLKKKMEEYEYLEKNASDLNVKHKKILEDKKILMERMNKKGKYFNIHEEYERKKFQIAELVVLLEKNNNLSKNNKLEREIIIKKIKEFEIYLNTEKRNREIELMINNLELNLKEIKISEYEEYNDYIILCQKIENCQNVIDVKKTEKEKITQELEKQIKINNEIDDLIEKRKNMEKYKNDIIHITKNLDPILKKYENLKYTLNELNTEIINNQNEKKHIMQYQNELNEISEVSSVNKLIIEIIKNGFIDDFLTKKVIPPLCNHLNSILNSYVTFELFMIYNNKKVTVLKKDKNNQYSNALKMSGYESLMTNIAFRLAINNINKLFRTDFFVIDEAFSFCDDDSTSKMQNLFDYMRKIYKYVIVISHNEQIKSYTDTDVLVSHTNGYSKIYFDKDKSEQKDKHQEENDKTTKNISDKKISNIKKTIVDSTGNNSSDSDSEMKSTKPKILANKKKKPSSTNLNKKNDKIKKTKQDLSAMTEEEKKEYRKQKKKEWGETHKAKVSEYNRKKYLEKTKK